MSGLIEPVMTSASIGWEEEKVLPADKRKLDFATLCRRLQLKGSVNTAISAAQNDDGWNGVRCAQRVSCVET